LLIVYASKTGNVERFVQKLGFRRLRLASGEEGVAEPCLLLTYTTGFGQAPEEVLRFVEHNRPHIRGVAVSGNRNWGSNFARAGDVLAERYGLIVVHRFELAGTARDVAIVKEVIGALSRAQQCGAA
jgi:protein involved in ribonucleotide reduction